MDDLEQTPIGPSSPKQNLILHQSNDTAIVGGAMGSGKSYVALLYPLKFADDPYLRGVIFRKTTGELTAQGGLWETACELYAYVFGKENIKVNQKHLKITFPSGGSIKFSHMEHDQNRFQHQGAQYTFVLFDEATHFSQVCIEYLGLRIRSARAKHKKQMVLTCNPDPDWFALDWIKPYLQEDGTPDLSQDGKTRYYVVEDGKYIWADHRSELEAIYGEGEESGIKTFTFISATCYDNPVLLANDRGYISTLKAKPFVDVQRYLYGNWFVRPSGSGMFKKSWCEPVKLFEQNIISYCRAWDIAGSLPSDLNPNPDWTCGVLMAKTKSLHYIIVDCIRFRARFGEVMEKIIQCAINDPEGTSIILPQEPGQAGKAAGQMMIKDLIAEGFHARMRPTNKSKTTRFQPVAAAAEASLVDYVEADWNKDYFAELEGFDGSRGNKDDQVDATSDAFITLAQKLNLPTFSIPTMSKSNEFSF